MSHRHLRSIGRQALAVCAVSLGAASLNAQTAPAAVTGPNPSRIDIFAGYSYYGAHGAVKPANINFSSVDVGAYLSGAYYFNKYVGAEISGAAHPNGQNDAIYGYQAGPIFRAPMQNFTLFAHALAGAAYVDGPNNDNPATEEHEPYRWGPTIVVGGGMDYDLPFFDHRFGLRLFQADYRWFHEDFGPANSIPVLGTPWLGGRANVGGAELSTGLLVHFGHIIPPPPVQYACSVTAPTGDIYPGDVVTVTGTATNLNPKKTPAYSWTGDSTGAISSTSNVASIDTKNLQPGTYKVTGHVSEGKKPGEMADCSSSFTVKAFQPPTISCSANPSTVMPGDPSTVTASGMSPQNRPLTYSYSATSGTISGNTSTATLATTGVAPGSITVTCNVVDDKGQTASATTSVMVQAPAPPPAPTTKNLCSIAFDRDHRRPTRVDNEAKACLDDIALAAQQDVNAKLAIAGNSAPAPEERGHGKAADRRHEMEVKRADHEAAERAVNEKEYLVTDKGIDASRISVYTGTAGTNTAATTLIPAGATFDTTGLTPVDETAVKAVPRTAPMKHHHKK